VKKHLRLFDSLGEIYKIKRINDLPEDEALSIYVLGDFVDLCRGPHLQSTNKVNILNY